MVKCLQTSYIYGDDFLYIPKDDANEGKVASDFPVPNLDLMHACLGKKSG